MADREFNVLISAETDNFVSNMNEAEREASGLGDVLSGEVSQGADDATDSLRETTEELRRLQREAIGSTDSVDSLGNSLSDTAGDADSATSSVDRLGNETDSLGNSLNNVTDSADDAGDSIDRLGNEASGLDSDMSSASSAADSLGSNLNGLSNDADETRDSVADLRAELRGMQRDAMGANASMNGIGGTFNNTSRESNKFNREMQRLSMILGGDVPESTKQAYGELSKLHQEARNASRVYGKYSQQAMNARDAINKYALSMDDATFKQIYMRSQLGLTDMQLRQQANSIKLNARMTKLMGNQTEILTQRMQGLAKHGIKPEDLLPPSTIGQFQMLNETMAAGRAPISKLSSAYRAFGTRMEQSIKGWSAQKMAIKEAQGDMVRYGLLMRGITAGLASMTLALPAVGIASFMAYKTMFKSALEADEALKQLAETTKSKVAKAFEPVIQAAGDFLEVAFKVIGVVADWIAKFNEAHPEIAAVAGVIGFLLPAMTLLLLPLGLGIGLWKGWAVVINGVWTMLGGAISMVGVASSTFLAFAAIVAVVAGAFIYLWNTNEDFKNACISIWEAIKTTIQTALDAIKEFLITHSDTIKSTIQAAYETVKNIIKTVLDAIKQIVKLVLDNIKQFWDEHGSTVKQAVKTIYETIKEIIKTVLDKVKEIVTLVLDNIKQFWLEHGVTVMQAVMNIYDTIKEIIKSILDTTKEIIDTVLKAIKDFWQKHGDTILKIAKKAWDLIKSAIQAVLDVIESIINGVCSAINGDWDTFWNEVGNVCKTAWELIKEVVKAGIDAIPGIISAAVGLVCSAIKGVFDAGVDIAKGFGTTMMNVGKDLISGLARGITSGVSSVVNAVSGAVKSAISAGKKLLGINSPSKLFMQFGEWTTEGYEIGVNRGEPASTKAVENFADNSINAFSDNALPATSNSNENTMSNNSNITININAGSLNNEQDMYKLAEIIDKKLAEIKDRNSRMFGGYKGAYY